MVFDNPSYIMLRLGTLMICPLFIHLIVSKLSFTRNQIIYWRAAICSVEDRHSNEERVIEMHEANVYEHLSASMFVRLNFMI